MNRYCALIVVGILATEVGWGRLSAAKVARAPVYSVAEIAFTGPRQAAKDSPSRDVQLAVAFRHESGSPEFKVQGFFDGDGKGGIEGDVSRDLPRTKQDGEDYLGIGSYGGGNDQNFPGQGVYGFNWWFNAKMASSDEIFLPHLPDDAFCTIGHVGKEVMLIVPSWRMVVAARGDWGGVRLEKTKLLAAATQTET